MDEIGGRRRRKEIKAVVIEIENVLRLFNRKHATICVTHIHEQIDRGNKSIHFPNELYRNKK